MKLEDLLLFGAVGLAIWYFLNHQNGATGTLTPVGSSPASYVPPAGAAQPSGGTVPGTPGGTPAAGALFPTGAIGGWTCAQFTDPYSGCNLYHVPANPGDCVARDNTGRCLAYLDNNGNAVYAL